jgi:hypothetical protein
VHDPLINWRLLNTTEAATEAALGREEAAAAAGGAPGAAGAVAVGGAAAGGGPGAVLTGTAGPQVGLSFSGRLYLQTRGVLCLCRMRLVLYAASTQTR